MKKLMIAAVVAAVGISAAQADVICKRGETTTPVYKVYKWKFTGVTTKGAKVSVADSICKKGGTAACTVRLPASLKIEGYTYYCGYACQDEVFELWNGEAFWMKKPFKAGFVEGGVYGELANIIGKKSKNFETVGQLKVTEKTTEGTTYDVTYAGLGKFDTKNKRVKSVSGNFAGTASAAWYVKGADCIVATYWNCADLSLVCPPEAYTVAYGKWSAKYKKSASKKLEKNGKVPSLPNGVAWLK